MTESFDANPYAAPAGDASFFLGVDRVGCGLYRDGNLLVATKHAVFPDRCVKCNAPAEGYWLSRHLFWHHPVVWLIAPVVIIYIVVALIVRKTAIYQIGLCPVHRRRRHMAILIGWGGFLSGTALMVVAARQGSVVLAMAAALLLVGTVVYGASASQIISPKRIDSRFAWIRGAGPEFLASIEADNAAG